MTARQAMSDRDDRRQIAWQRILSEYAEGDTISGVVTQRLKTGLLVDVGFEVFLPASQVDAEPTDLDGLAGKAIDCKILKIDKERRNLVVSRRRLLVERQARES
jgi:small subunit ribosomal protein S1